MEEYTLYVWFHGCKEPVDFNIRHIAKDISGIETYINSLFLAYPNIWKIGWDKAWRKKRWVGEEEVSI